MKTLTLENGKIKSVSLEASGVALSGFTVGTGSVTAGDTVLSALQKLYGNTADILSNMKVDSSGNFEFGDLSGALSFFDIGKTKLTGSAHSDIFRVKHHTPLSDTIGDFRVIWSAGVRAGANNVALSSVAVRNENTFDWTTASLGLTLTLDNFVNNIWGGQLMLSNYAGIGGVAINHNVAQARLHVEAGEKYSTILATNYGGAGGVNIVNKNTTNSSYISLSSFIGQDPAYIEKFPLGNPYHSGKMYIANTEGEIEFLILGISTYKISDSRILFMKPTRSLTSYVDNSGIAIGTFDDSYKYVECINTTAIDIYLPSAVGREGQEHIITRSGSGAVTLLPATFETLAGQTSLSISNQHDAIRLWSNGVNWLRG